MDASSNNPVPLHRKPGLAPPFTPETAPEFARRATISREFNRAMFKAAYSKSGTKELLSAQARAAKQVHRVLNWMDKTKDRIEFSELCSMLDRLWDKAYPKQASVRVGRSRPAPPTLSPEPVPSQVVPL